MTCVVRKQIGYNYDKSYFLILNLAIQYVIIWNVILKCLASEASQKNNKHPSQVEKGALNVLLVHCPN